MLTVYDIRKKIKGSLGRWKSHAINIYFTAEKTKVISDTKILLLRTYCNLSEEPEGQERFLLHHKKDSKQWGSICGKFTLPIPGRILKATQLIKDSAVR